MYAILYLYIYFSDSYVLPYHIVRKFGVFYLVVDVSQ